MKRPADEILASVNPVKSAKKYDQTWQEFIKYSGINQGTKPTEENYLQFFDYLKNIKKYACSTIWSSYSKLNHKHQIYFGEKLQIYPRITHLLKSYESGYIRKTAKAFSKEEIDRYLESAPDSEDHVHIKVAVILGYFGGLRCADLISINCDDCDFNENTGMWVTYTVSKQRGEEIKNKFNIPLHYCQYLENYDHALYRCNASEGRLFKTYRKRQDGSTYYTKQPMGIHLIRKFTVKVAEFLNLPNAELYTGHSLRRSGANTLAEAGVSTTQLKKHFNWKNEGTALRYVDNTESSKLSISKSMNSDQTSRSGVVDNVTKTLHVENCSNIIINF